MKGCNIGATPLELLIKPVGLLALHGRDGEGDGAKPDEDADEKNESKDGAKPDGDKGEGDKGDKADDNVETLKRKLANAEEARNRAVDKKDELVQEVKDLQAKITKMEKDGSPDETIKAENEELKKTNATLASTNERLRLEIALRDDTGHDWVKPSAVLKLVDLSEVDFDAKTGEPRGFKAALDKLAKESPFLLKPKANDDDDKDGKPAPRSTGKTPAPKGNAADAKAAADAAKLRAKYPALRR